jgi:hypothetical protein
MYLFLLIKRILDAGFVEIVENKTGLKAETLKLTPDWILITAKGREFVESLGSKEVGY